MAMYTLPPEIRAELKADGYLTTRAVEFLLTHCAEEMKLRDGVFVFQVGMIPVILRDNKQFGSESEDDIIKQRREFFKSRKMDKSTDLFFPILEDNHYLLMRITAEENGCIVQFYNSLQQNHRKTYWNKTINSIFEWLLVVFPFHIMLSKKEKGLRIEHKEAPRQVGTVDCGIFVIGFVAHLVVKDELHLNYFTQRDVSRLCVQIIKDSHMPVSLGSLMLTGYNIPSSYQKNPSAVHPNVTVLRGSGDSIATGGSAVEATDDGSVSVHDDSGSVQLRRSIRNQSKIIRSEQKTVVCLPTLQSLIVPKKRRQPDNTI